MMTRLTQKIGISINSFFQFSQIKFLCKKKKNKTKKVIYYFDK